MKTYNIKHISGTTLYKVMIPCQVKIPLMHMSFTRKINLVYNNYREEFYFEDQQQKFDTNNLVQCSPEEFFQYSTVYEDDLDIGLGLYELQAIQKAMIEYADSVRFFSTESTSGTISVPCSTEKY